MAAGNGSLSPASLPGIQRGATCRLYGELVGKGTKVNVRSELSWRAREEFKNGCGGDCDAVRKSITIREMIWQMPLGTARLLDSLASLDRTGLEWLTSSVAAMGKAKDGRTRRGQKDTGLMSTKHCAPLFKVVIREG